MFLEQASGSRGQDAAPGAERGRTVLMLGWRLLRHRGGTEGWWGAFEVLAMGRAGWVGLAARLMFAGRDRSRALRSRLPQTSGGYAGWGHSRDGDRC